MILDENTVRIRLSFSVDQALGRLEVEETADNVTITAWVGWRPDPAHVHEPTEPAAGKAIFTRDVMVSQGLGRRKLVDGARPHETVDPRLSAPSAHHQLTDVRPVPLTRIQALGDRTVLVDLSLKLAQRVDHFEVDEARRDRVTIIAWVGSSQGAAAPSSAADRPTIVHTKYVTLARPLGARRLIDGATSNARPRIGY